MPAVMPQMSEGAIARWAKSVGESVKAGEVLLEVEADKVVVDVESPHDGVVSEILVPEGIREVEVGTLIARLTASPAAQ